MALSIIPYDGPERCEILHLILSFNSAHHSIDHIITRGITTDDVAKVESLKTFEQERNLKNTLLDSDLDTLIKDLESIRKVGGQEEMGRIEWERIAGSLRRLWELVDFNRKKFSVQKAKAEAKEKERAIREVRQKRAEIEAREAKEKRDAEKKKQAERNTRETRERPNKEAELKKWKDAKERAEREKKTAPKSPARLEVPGKAQRPMSPAKQNRPLSPNVHFPPTSPNKQNQTPIPTKPNTQNRFMSPNKPANQKPQTRPNKPNNQIRPVSPKTNDSPKDPAKKLQKTKPRILTEVKEERLKKAHAVGLALASEVRKFD
jgi:hypothetical protein